MVLSVAVSSSQHSEGMMNESTMSEMEDADLLIFIAGGMVLGAIFTVFMMIFCAIAYQKQRSNELARRRFIPRFNYNYSIKPQFQTIRIHPSVSRGRGLEEISDFDDEIISLSSSENEWVNMFHQYRASASSLNLLDNHQSQVKASVHSYYKKRLQSSSSSSDDSNTQYHGRYSGRVTSPDSWLSADQRKDSLASLGIDDNDRRPLFIRSNSDNVRSSVFTIQDEVEEVFIPPPHPRASQIQHLDSFIY